jgi:hypothetical protein
METPDDRQEIGGPIVDSIAGIRVQRNPNLRFGGRKMEVGGHDAEDLPADTFELDRTADDGGIGSELLLPQSVAEDDEVILAGLVVAGAEDPAEERAGAENLKEFGGDQRGSETKGFATAIEIKFVALGVGGDVKRFGLVAKGDERAFRIGAGNADETLRLRERKRTKKDVVDEREDGGIGADAESKGQGRDERKGGRFAEGAESVAEIAKESFKERQRTLFADRFLGLLETAQLKEGLAAGFVGREAAAEVVVDVELEVRLEFLAELPVEGCTAAEEIAEAGEAGAKSSHVFALLWGNKRRIEQFIWESNRKRKRPGCTY